MKPKKSGMARKQSGKAPPAGRKATGKALPAKRKPAENTLAADLIPTAEAAELKGLSPRTLNQHALRGYVPGAVKSGGENGIWMYSRKALLEWTQARRGRPSGEGYSG